MTALWINFTNNIGAIPHYKRKLITSEGELFTKYTTFSEYNSVPVGKY